VVAEALLRPSALDSMEWERGGVVWCGASLCGSSEERETRRVGGPAGERPFAGSKQRKGEENDGEAEAG